MQRWRYLARYLWQIPLFLKMGGLLLIVYLALQVPTLPGGVVIIYMILATLGIVLYITLDDQRIGEFLSFFRDPSPSVRYARLAVLVLAPLIAGFFAYQAAVPKYPPPFRLFVLHPSPPEEVWQVEVPPWVLEWRQEDVEKGRVIYENNCIYCHGKDLDGKGPSASAFQYPTAPVSFKDPGTIATLQLPYVYWKVSRGGIQNQFNSAMPSWRVGIYGEEETVHGGDLTSEEVWQVILYIYRASGREPAKFGGG